MKKLLIIILIACVNCNGTELVYKTTSEKEKECNKPDNSWYGYCNMEFEYCPMEVDIKGNRSTNQDKVEECTEAWADCIKRYHKLCMNTY